VLFLALQNAERRSEIEAFFRKAEGREREDRKDRSWLNCALLLDWIGLWQFLQMFVIRLTLFHPFIINLLCRLEGMLWGGECVAVGKKGWVGTWVVWNAMLSCRCIVAIIIMNLSDKRKLFEEDN
jgi:hypothetical protein